CALTVHFISDGLIPCRENQLKNELLLPLVGVCIPGDKPCPFQPLYGPAQLVDSGRSALDALVGLDIQLFRNRLIGDPPLHSNNAAGVIHERPDAEHIDLTRKHGQPTQRSRSSSLIWKAGIVRIRLLRLTWRIWCAN